MRIVVTRRPPRDALDMLDPGCLFDVPIFFNTQGRIARVTSERGAVLPLMAIVILVLMGAAAMAVDLGWLYYSTSTIPISTTTCR